MPGIPLSIPKESDTLLIAEDVERPLSELTAISRSLQPSMAYLAVASSVSARAAYPQSRRKLLVLDLNGTLLLRPKPRNTKRRPIHPRPYMPSFCSYIFHENVKPWLEAIVWSSAQPHSVDDMVARCFENRRLDLKAIWARDTLGLEKNDYFRKVQTVKDLKRCWSVLADSRSSHSAETTLLIDDSARKAQLHPYNHLCVPEYTQNMRNRDLNVKRNPPLPPKDRKTQVVEQVQSIFPKLSGGPFTSTKRNNKRLHKAHPGFDSTLIAVIGILDEIKDQTNVAGWIRAGGLWAGQEPPPPSSSPFELFSDDGEDGYESNLLASDDRRIRQRQPKLDKTERSSPSNPGNDVASAEGDPMWFDHSPCYQYWVDRGTRVTKALGIELHHGITR